jgi:class 3 adenylate cyclase
MDPEDVRSLLAPYWQHLRDELERFGGTVEKFIGDAVMALFGAPVAHEDDPERAVRAALAIRDWAREEDDLQVGSQSTRARRWSFSERGRPRARGWRPVTWSTPLPASRRPHR